MAVSFSQLRADERAVSTAVGYVLAIGITVVLVSGLVMTMGGLLDGQHDRAAETEVRSIAEGIATEVTTLERATADDALAASKLHIPDRVAGSAYTISLEDCPDGDGSCLRVATDDHSHTVALTVAVEPESVTGGDVWLIVDTGTVSLATERPT